MQIDNQTWKEVPRPLTDPGIVYNFPSITECTNGKDTKLVSSEDGCASLNHD